MKRIQIILMTIMALGFYVSASAAPITLTVGSGTTEPGEEVVIPISADLPGEIAGATFTVTYPSDLTLTSVLSTFFDTFANQWQLIDPVPSAPTSVVVDLVSYTRPLVTNAVTGGMRISAARVKSGSSQQNLFNLVFTVAGNAAPGEYPITLIQTVLNNTAAGYDAGGENVPMLVGAVAGETNLSLAYPVLIVDQVVSGKITVVAPIVDVDNDDMEDDWEMLHFKTLDRDGTGDYDKDGISDLQEYLDETDPTRKNMKSVSIEIASGNFDSDVNREFATAVVYEDFSVGVTFYDNDGEILNHIFPDYHFSEISIASGNFDSDNQQEVVLAGVNKNDGSLLALIYDVDGTLLKTTTGGQCSNVKVAAGRFNTATIQDEFVVTLLQSDQTLAVITFNFDGSRVGKGVGGKCSNLDIAVGNFDEDATEDEYVVSLLQADGTLGAITFQGNGDRIEKGEGGICHNVSVAVGNFSDTYSQDEYVVSLLQQDGTMAGIAFYYDGDRIGKSEGGIGYNLRVAAGKFAATNPLDGYAVALCQSDFTPAVIFNRAGGIRIGKGVVAKVASVVDLDCGDITGDGIDEAVMAFINASDSDEWVVFGEDGVSLLQSP